MFYNGIPLVCPHCRQRIRNQHDGFICDHCKKMFSHHDGIPDFRVFEDPYLSFGDDSRRTDVVLDGLADHDLESLLEYYWSYSDITPVPLRRKYVQSALRGKTKADRTIDLLSKASFRPRRVLDVGSGTGAFLLAASREYEQVVGIDIAMRWLHVSRRRFMDENQEAPPLICCCAEQMPFPDGYFDMVVATSVLEFTCDAAKVVAECARVLSHRGVMFVNTVNRFSLAREPHVYLWGVGFLPRGWQAAYVRWRTQACYDNIRLLSYGDLRRLTKRQFPIHTIQNQDIDDESLQQFSAFTRALVATYRVANRLPLISFVLRWLGPGWEACFQKRM